ncbi:unnamed protein product [Mytilus edulis]|uniref:Uncharacterized protein n=1 Tax=Mytilus edulis TaxID=6550 RepID=A0A8S3TZK7_MYTED|nr:unnamed protein product [Mytilus edulis]
MVTVSDDNTDDESKNASTQTISCIDIQRYRSLEKAIRVTAYVLRFIQNLRNSKDKRSIGFISVEERCKALKVLIVTVQQETFKDEIESLNSSSQKKVPLTYKHDKRQKDWDQCCSTYPIIRVWKGKIRTKKQEEKEPNDTSISFSLFLKCAKKALSSKKGRQQLFWDTYSYFWHYFFEDAAAEARMAEEEGFDNDFYSDFDEEFY